MGQIQPERGLIKKDALALQHGAGLLQCGGSVQGYERTLEGLGVAQAAQVFDTGVNAQPRGVDLGKLAHPGAAFFNRLVVTDRQRQQCLELAHAQVAPERVVARSQTDQRGHQALVGQARFVECVKQITALLLVKVAQVANRFAQGVGDAVVLPLQVFQRVNLGHAGHDDAAGIDAQVGEVGHIDVVAQGVDGILQPGVILRRAGAEVPVAKGEVAFGSKKVPTDDAAGIDEMDFQVGCAGHLVQIQTRGRKAAQRVQGAALQQFGERALQRHFQARVRAKTRKAALVVRVEQGHVHDRKLPAQRSVLDHNAKARRAQARNACGNAGVAVDHFLGYIGQAQAFAQDAELDMALEDF